MSKLIEQEVGALSFRLYLRVGHSNCTVDEPQNLHDPM